MFFRNPEIKRYLLIQLMASVALTLISWSVNKHAGICVALTCVALNILFYIYTAIRYRRIKELSSYLTRISNGEYTLDVRDNKEGELSILKSEIYKVTEMLTEYAQKLQKEKLYLSESLADISHQLKTPLTSMIIMCEILNEPDLPIEKREEFVTLINLQLERIGWLVSTLLKISRLDAGVVMMRKERINVSELVVKALTPLWASINSKELTISKNIKPDAAISCDIQWTCEAIINILKNCIEHTPEKGEIEIDYQENPLFYELSLKDNGVGISKKELPHIFTRFYRGENASSDSVGIGLAMARSIIRNQQGDIIVESQKQKGSKFIIRLYKTVV